MNKPEITMLVINEETGYSAHAYIGEAFIGTQGETMEEVREMAADAVNLFFEENGWEYNCDEIRFEYEDPINI